MGLSERATAPQTTPLLTISVPLGLQFAANPGGVLVQGDGQGLRSTKELIDTTAGLRVEPNQTLALIGGDVKLLGGTLKTAGGRIELGSVAGSSLVSLTPTDKGWALGYEDVQNFGDIQLSQKTAVDASGEGGGDIQVRGYQVKVTDSSQILANTLGSRLGGTLKVLASNSVQVMGGSLLYASTFDAGPAGSLNITTGKLIVSEGAQAATETGDRGKGGNLYVNASDSVQIMGSGSRLSAETFSDLGGAAGSLTINTGKLIVSEGAGVITDTYNQGGEAGNLYVNASDSVELTGTGYLFGTPFRGTLSAGTYAAGAAGDLTIETGQLSVRDEATVAVNSVNIGNGVGAAGNLNVTASAIRLNNQGKLIATTNSGNGGNITLQAQDFLLLGNNSQISTSAGTAQTGGDGGKIVVNSPFLIALPDENSDITANAFLGKGGSIDITTQSLFSFEQLSLQQLQTRLGTDNPNELDPSRLPSNDITAISQTDASLSGFVRFNVPDFDPTQGLVELPAQLADASNQIASSCAAGGENKFTIAGRGGLPPNPREPLNGEAVLTNWATLEGSREQGRAGSRDELGGIHHSLLPTPHSPSSTIVEATGWMVNDKGDVVLTATAPAANQDIPWLPESGCHASQPSS